MSLTAREYSSDELALRLRQQELVAEFGRFAMLADSLDRILNEAARVAAEGLGARFAKVLEWLPGDMAFLVRSGVGWKPGVVGHAVVGGDLHSPAGYAFRSGKPVISNHLAREQRFRTPKLLADHDIRSAINVLISAPGLDPFGVLEADSTDRHDFNDHDIAFLSALANTLAVAIETQKRQDLRDQLLVEKDELLREKDLLMQEVHHRVGNSLQLVQTLLSLQARLPANQGARDQLREAAARITAIGTVHKRLYQGPSVQASDAAVYLRGVLDDMEGMLADASGSRGITLEMQPILLGADQLAPLGLIAGELVTNALKHGQGAVKVTVEQVEGALEVRVTDEGPGLPADFDPANSQGLGMRLVAALSKSGDDSIRVDRSVPRACIVARLTLEPLPST
jgi:two-component sensor histidine kinase